MFSSCLINIDLFIHPGNRHLDHNIEHFQICTGLPPAPHGHSLPTCRGSHFPDLNRTSSKWSPTGL